MINYECSLPGFTAADIIYERTFAGRCKVHCHYTHAVSVGHVKATRWRIRCV